MEQSKIEKMLERLLANQYKMEAEKKADKAESVPRMEADKRVSDGKWCHESQSGCQPERT
jgi:hypothetical protein